MTAWLRWPWLGVKWTLVALGVYVSFGLALIEFREKRVGLGMGMVAAIVIGSIKGLLTRTRSRGRHRHAESL